MSLTALNSAARFVLVWTLYKAVCLMAVVCFGIPAESIPREMIPTSGSSGDPNVYQQLADITFLLFKPFDFLLKGIFLAASLFVSWESLQKLPDPSNTSKWRQLFRDMWRGPLQSCRFAWSALLRVHRYMLCYVAMGGFTALYQGLCLLVVPFLFAIRKLMNLQLTFPITLFQGKGWKTALQESTERVQSARKHLYLPYLLLLLTPKLLGVGRDLVVKAFPDRLFIDVPEITWGLIATTTVMAFLIDRMAEIFPVVIYASTQQKDDQN